MARPRQFSSFREIPRQLPTIAAERIELLDPNDVAQGLASRSEEEGGLAQLISQARERDLRPVENQVFGYRLGVQATREIAPDKYARPGPGVNDVDVEILLQSYSREDTEAAVGTVTITGGEYTEEYHLLVEAPDGDFGRVREFTVQEGQLVETNSWWTAFSGCVGGCASGCASALVSCRGTWVEFLWCLVERCGLCVLRCVGCATCNCSWWCGWATGCCRQ
jgi:hypothetical protein